MWVLELTQLRRDWEGRIWKASPPGHVARPELVAACRRLCGQLQDCSPSGAVQKRAHLCGGLLTRDYGGLLTRDCGGLPTRDCGALLVSQEDGPDSGWRQSEDHQAPSTSAVPAPL